LTMVDCDFLNGQAKHGGNVYISGCDVSFTDSTFKGGKVSTSGYGGNLYLYNATSGSNKGTITGCTFEGRNDVTAYFGGNIFAQGYEFALTDCSLTGGKARCGGSIYNVNQPLIITNTTITGGYATKEGGNIQQKNSYMRLVSGIISGGKADETGGNISIANKGTAYFNGGTISGGTAPNGGNIATAIASTTGCTLEFNGTKVIGGTATGDGGNVYAVAAEGYAGKPTVKITAGIITEGTAAGGGGNVYLGGKDKEAETADKAAIAQRLVSFTMTGGTLGGEIPQGKDYACEAANGGNIFALFTTATISGGEVSNGHATTSGGNIYPSTASTVTISGTAVISNGIADSKGGNFYTSSTNSDLRIAGGTIQNGTTYGDGGNIYHGNGKVTITGGVITGGHAEASGGNIFASMGYGANAKYCGTLTIKDDGNTETPLPQITNGTAVLNGGNIGISCSGNAAETGANKAVLGNFLVSGGKAKTAGDEVYINGIAILEILPEFAQQIPVYISHAAVNGLLPDKLPGATLTEGRGISSGVFTGKMVIENHDNIFIYAVDGDTRLHLAGAATVKNGDKTWYKSNADAVADYEGADYLQAAPGELALSGGIYTVDFAGQEVAVVGEGFVIGFDSSNDTYETFGSATFTNVTLLNQGLQQIGDKFYYALEDNGTYTFHRMGVKMSTVAMRPSSAGVYFSGVWDCDEVLAPHINAFGVAVSLKGMPEDGFDVAQNPTSMWTAYTAEDYSKGIKKTGVMVSDILKTEDEARVAKNSEYAQKKIYAVAYVTLDHMSYTGSGVQVSLYDILSLISNNMEEHYDKEETLQQFMAYWSEKGLSGEPWNTLNFQVSPAISQLKTLYADKQAYYGELHDHAETYGTSDGKQTLDVWKSEMERLSMDFAAIVDHRQSSHMYLEEWDNTMFIGGSEASTTITDRTGVKLHYNMIFSDPAGLETVVSQFAKFNWKYYPPDYAGENAEKLAGGWHFNYPSFTAAEFTEVCNAVYANGGFVSIVHPKSAGYIESDDPADAYFRDGVAIEVFYTYHSTRNGWKVAANYQLWKSMIEAGYKVYASAGNDEHDMPSDKAVSVIHATERNATAYVESLRAGNFVAGGVDVRTAIGDTAMGGTTSFTGKQMAVSVEGFHKSLYKPGHVYRVDVITDQGVAFTQEISCTENFYHVLDVDAAADYYYVEIHDVTDQSMLAIGNPIWNADK